jgi:hypothetical protein
VLAEYNRERYFLHRSVRSRHCFFDTLQQGGSEMTEEAQRL